jgi:hypothetical protein
MMRTTPLRRISLHFSQIRRTLDRTFMAASPFFHAARHGKDLRYQPAAGWQAGAEKNGTPGRSGTDG